MSRSQITKLLLLRGESSDLPDMLEVGQFAYTRDQGRLFAGQIADDTLLARTSFPYTNAEILTENSASTFAEMQGSLIRSGDDKDYYNAEITPSGPEWNPIEILRDGILKPFTIENIDNVMMNIDYAIFLETGERFRMGKMQMTYFHNLTNPREPQIEESGLNIRTPSSFDPRIAYQSPCTLRFKVMNTTVPSMVFEYRNTGTENLILRFRTDRPKPFVYEQW